MSKDTTLNRVKIDINKGYLGTARDRLHGLIFSYPDDLSLRPKLAEVYWRLKHPGMAGLYWYLDSKSNPDIQKAIASFTRECGGDPLKMLSRLKIRWDPAQMPEGYAKDKIQKLVNDCKTQHKYIPIFPKGSSPTYRDKPSQIKDAIMLWGCGLTAFIILFIIIIGIVTVIGWFV